MSTGGSGPTPTGVAILSPVLGYKDNARFMVTITSSSFNVADTITSVQPFDTLSNPLTPWTINSQSQDTVGETITGVFTAGNGLPSTPGAIPSGMPTGTIVITTHGSVTVTVPVKPITIDPCA